MPPASDLLRSFSSLRLASTSSPFTRPPPPLSSTLQRWTRRDFSSTGKAEWKGGDRNPRAKLKSHKGAKKRFRATEEGQFIRAQTGTSHLMVGTSRSVRRRLKPHVVVHPTHHTLLRKLLPYEGSRGAFRAVSERETVWWKSGALQKSGSALEAAIQRAKAGAQAAAAGKGEAASVAGKEV